MITKQKRKKVSRAFGIFVLLFIMGCGYTRPTLFEPKSTIWEPQTKLGREYKEKYLSNLQALLSDLRNIRELRDIDLSLRFGAGDRADSLYLSVGTKTVYRYNILQTRFEIRAATSIAELLLPILQTIDKQKEPLYDPSVNGVCLSIIWLAANFTRTFSDEYEGVLIFIPRRTVEDFLRYKLTNQDLLDQSEIFGYKSERNIGKIRIDVDKIL